MGACQSVQRVPWIAEEILFIVPRRQAPFKPGPASLSNSRSTNGVLSFAVLLPSESGSVRSEQDGGGSAR